MTGWEWWAGHLDEPIYDIAGGCASRADVIAQARENIGDRETFRIIEARSSTSLKFEADDFVPFMQTRNAEIIAPDIAL